MKTTITIIIVGLVNALLFFLNFKSFSDFLTRESILTANLIFAIFAILVLINDFYKSHRDNKIEPIKTYFDEEVKEQEHEQEREPQEQEKKFNVGEF